ncbi:MAG TPA: hypothetical protein PK020_18945 [Ilumatobacteraceae bacterium]|nr:hypothetical protein [Ilumatobacteraceae bacterium]HRB02195.1 hypothetical protein [Ilumatobacteraceae bacterium]
MITPDRTNWPGRIHYQVGSHAHFTAETDEFGEWHLAIRTPHAPGRPDGRTSTTTFWTVTDPSLNDILDALTMIAAHTQTGATS